MCKGDLKYFKKRRGFSSPQFEHRGKTKIEYLSCGPSIKRIKRLCFFVNRRIVSVFCPADFSEERQRSRDKIP